MSETDEQFARMTDTILDLRRQLEVSAGQAKYWNAQCLEAWQKRDELGAMLKAVEGQLSEAQAKCVVMRQYIDLSIEHEAMMANDEYSSEEYDAAEEKIRGLLQQISGPNPGAPLLAYVKKLETAVAAAKEGNGKAFRDALDALAAREKEKP